MDNDDTLATLLNSHPIFSTPSKTFLPSHDSSLELSTNTLSSFKPANVSDNSATGRRQVMVLRDTDLILAAGKELRITSLSDAKARRSHTKNYKIALNSSGKLLAVAGAFQLAVVVLPRAGYSRLVPDIIDCK
ncbi:Nucleoporin nup82 [Lentinula edodes]|uniref:Nucleoporin nup82 n=1 Tax=Lentinula edodes TaxID=5353 RepID=A0A1Q3DW35_LENED|nr:Nucleoporin nup82 [Lentinula edodes]